MNTASSLATKVRKAAAPGSAAPPSSTPHVAQFAGGNFVIGGGVAIFHVKSGRVVLLYHPRDNYYFLPKGRRDVNETTEQGAEREGFEESGYRNRLFPLPLRHRQPQPRIPLDARISTLSTEPVWCQVMPQTNSSQYLLFWYVAETIPPAVEEELDRAVQEAGITAFGEPYQYPPKCPLTLSMRERFAMEPEGYQPKHHEDTSADEEEALYQSELVDVETARDRLGRGSVMADVVRIGWEAIQQRMVAEGLT